MHLGRWIGAAVALVILLGSAPRAGAQVLPANAILYDQYTVANNQLAQQLAAINPDGTGDHTLAVNLPEKGYPTWSRDGRLLALTSVDPATPFTLSRDVFVLDMQTAQISQITSFADTTDYPNGPGGSAVVTACVLPWYKVFSPDLTRVAVAGVVFTGITWSSPPDDVTPNDPDDLYSGLQGTPALQIYSMDGTPGALVAADSQGSDTIHGGDGVDWSPDGKLLVYPKDTAVEVNNFGQTLTVPVTALFLMAPVNDAVGSGQAAQLTRPTGSAGQTLSGPVTLWETDFQPAFSPDGKQVAYLRAENALSGAYPAPEQISLRMIGADGSNDHELLSFNAGVYVSHVSWSPDGTKLVFDAGKEEMDGEIPLPMADPTTSTLWIVNADGTSPTQLRGAAAAWPAWYPGAAFGAAPRLNIALVPQAGGPRLVLSWPVGNGNFVLQSSPVLGPNAAWQNEGTQPTITGGQASVTLNPAGGANFYRLLQQ
jgi:Tol biopolymer transport system component